MSRGKDAWLLPYSGFITVLFGLFVVLYAGSRADVEKFRKLAQGLRQGLGDKTVRDIPTNGGSVRQTPKEAASASPAQKELLDQVQRILEKSDAPIALRRSPEALVVRVMTGGGAGRGESLFDPGEPRVRRERIPGMDRIGAALAGVLAVNGVRLSVEGHSDSLETSSSGASQKTGWELSSARASELVDFWIRRHQLDPTRVSATGLSEFHPIADNESDGGRAANRRVEIVVRSDSSHP